jgi:nucleotide-binding universal stress UspA family protein
MQRRHFRNVLVNTTEGADDSAVRWVARLAVATSAKLTLADVVEPLPAAVQRYVPPGWQIPKLVRAEKQAHLERTAARIERLGVDPAIAMLAGTRAKALVREVVRGRHDLLATDVSAPNKGTAIGLVRECPCPVLFARPSNRRRRRRVLVAVDAGMSSPKQTTAFNHALLETATWLAECQDSELHVLHAWVPYGERSLRRSGVPPAEVQRFFAGIRAEAFEDLEPSLAPFRERIPSDHVHLVRGDPRVEIARFAAAHRIDLLVIGTVARKGLMARVIGNTAESLLTTMPCSMLVIKPVNVARRRAAAT